MKTFINGIEEVLTSYGTNTIMPKNKPVNPTKKTESNILKLTNCLKKFYKKQENDPNNIRLKKNIYYTEKQLQQAKLAQEPSNANCNFNDLNKTLQHFNCYYTIDELSSQFKLSFIDLKSKQIIKEFLCDVQPTEKAILNFLKQL